MIFKIAVVFHYEDGKWWAEAADVPDYVAWADTFDELRALVAEGLEFHLERPVEIVAITAFDFKVTESADAIHVSTSVGSQPAPFSLALIPAGRILDLSGGPLPSEERVAS